MTETYRRLPKLMLPLSIVLAGLTAASCATRSPAPEQVQTSGPSVTYKYRDDQELVQANQSAVSFCDRYGSVPGKANIKNDPDGGRVIVFECAPAPHAATTAMAQPAPNSTYNYRTDQELLDASRNAQLYCRNAGAQRLTSNIVVNPDGTRTVAFQCTSP